MKRRDFLGGMAFLSVCPLCARVARGAEGTGWSYEGKTGPANWGALDEANGACSLGFQQSPVDIAGAIEADLPPLVPEWKPGGAIVNTGQTIQIDVPEGSRLMRGERVFRLLQYHFHAPSEHTVEGRSFPMEVHFVHQDSQSGALGVLGVFLAPGDANKTFARLAASFPLQEGEAAAVETDADPNGLLPKTLAYWTYAGSLTTPPCTEIVEWMVVRAPLPVASEDIARFTALYPTNARPVMATNRRFILASRG